jgi:hypothetical protein
MGLYISTSINLVLNLPNQNYRNLEAKSILFSSLTQFIPILVLRVILIQELYISMPPHCPLNTVIAWNSLWLNAIFL